MGADRSPTAHYRPDIDGLRAIAVLFVVFFHGGLNEFPGGFVGVDVFFVISGFLITGIILRDLDAGAFSFADFYVRRVKRIFPALFAMLTLSAIAGVFLLVPQDLQELGQSLSSALFFFANWRFYTQVGYFDGPAVEKPLLHTWSLAVEEQYYLAWPLLLFLVYRLVGRKRLPYLLPGLLCASLLASELILRGDAARAFYLLPYRGWELLLGAWVAIVHPRTPTKWVASLLGATGLCAIAYAAVAFDSKTPFPGLNGLLPCGGAALLILAGLRENLLSHRILGSAPFRFVGKISYSLYLIHWPIFSFARMSLDREVTQVECLAIIAFSFVAATLSYKFIETPARKAKVSLPRLAGTTVAATAALGGCVILFHVTHGLPSRVPASVVQADAAREVNQKKKSECRRDQVLPKLSCGIGVPPRDGQYDFVIWGDSHALHLALAFSRHAAERDLSGVILSSGGCPALLNDNRLGSACIKDNEQIAKWIKTQTRLKIVFLAGAWSLYAKKGQFAVEDETDAGFDNARDRKGLAGALALLRSLAIQSVIVEDVPIFPRNVGLCAARAKMFARPYEHCFTLARSQFDQDEREAATVLHQIGNRFGVPLLNTAQAFCGRDACVGEDQGVILYRDKDHLNKAGSAYLGSKLIIPWPESVPRQGELTQLNTTASSAN
jgi:peptidoglycan/LPS O-acetylase OafA/YrhL